mmetsp:Transcript_23202/g.49405  ORF Transcript_23202/g.49405 Transcript_23202/m.49405 type:complete len:254 (-) Transcript_23202:550-1311(-)
MGKRRQRNEHKWTKKEGTCSATKQHNENTRGRTIEQSQNGVSVFEMVCADWVDKREIPREDCRIRCTAIHTDPRKRKPHMPQQSVAVSPKVVHGNKTPSRATSEYVLVVSTAQYSALTTRQQPLFCGVIGILECEPIPAAVAVFRLAEIDAFLECVGGQYLDTLGAAPWHRCLAQREGGSLVVFFFVCAFAEGFGFGSRCFLDVVVVGRAVLFENDGARPCPARNRNRHGGYPQQHCYHRCRPGETRSEKKHR